MVEQDAAPAGGRRTLLPSSRAVTGLRLGAIGPPARSWLMAGRTARSEFEGTAAQKESCWRAIGRPAGGCQKRGPSPFKTPRWRAERRRIFPKGGCAIDYLTRLLGAPFPRISRDEGKTGLPRAATKNRGDFSWLFDN